MLLPLQFTNQKEIDTSSDLDSLVSSSLNVYLDEEEEYYKSIHLENWYEEWDFKHFNPNIYSHGFHQYPAKFIPQLARKLLRVFTNQKSVILDNFMGSGTTLIESMLLNSREAIGIELNPFACFMAKVKTTPILPKKLIESFKTIQSEYFTLKEFPIHQFFNIEFWFKEKQILDLSKLRNVIVNLSNEEIKNFFFLCMSEVVRKVSLTNHNGFKLHRDKTKLKESFAPSVWDEFETVAQRNIALMKNFYYKTKESQTQVRIISGDSREKQNIEKNSIDFILTSPPYGDSRTTVAYGQFSRLSWQWIKNDEKIQSLDENLLGGRTLRDSTEILEYSKKLKLQYKEIQLQDPKRAKDVLSFYSDLFQTLQNAYEYLKPNHYFVLVTGNRTVKNIFLRTEIILSELAKKIGFQTEKILYRNIINKRMPDKNSPSNKKGEISNTMLKENIIFLRK